MKNFTYKNFIFIFLISLGFSVQAQDEFCGTQTTQEDLDYIRELKPQLKLYEEQYYDLMNNRSSTAPTSIPIKAHIIRTSAGTGGLTEAQLNAAMSNMNAYYANALMEFFICDGINYIDDSNYYDYETDEEAALRAAHQVDGLVNIYFTDDITSSSSGGGLCGYAYYPGGPDVILMQNSCAINGSTLIHEVGHFFSLIHTHGPSNSELTTELVDGSNCSTDGDLLCDTPADPQLGTSTVTSACVYTGTAVDGNGAAFTPDPTNIMSYSRKACRTYLSPSQYARMYAAFKTVRNYFECPTLNIDFTADVISSCESSLDVNLTDNSVGATSWEWDVDGDDIVDYTTQNVTHSYTTSGSFDVNLKISDGTTTISKTLEKYIKVGTQDNIPLNVDFDTLTIASEIDWSSFDVNGAGYNWSIRTGATPSPNTGPLNDVSGSGKYIYTEATGSNPSDVAELITSCTEINSGNAILDFSYHMFGGTMGELHVDIDSGSGFVNDVTPALIGQQQALESDAFISRQVDLSGYANESIRIRFRAIRGSNFQSDIALDNVSITGTLSVNSFEFDTVTLFPNPVNNTVLNVKTNSDASNVDFTINNLLGQNIMSGKLIENKIDVSAINSGTYFLTLSVGNSKIVKKFIKQ
jgi:PKD repeat protein